MWDQLRAKRERFQAIEAEMATPAVASDSARLQELAIERAQLQPAVQLLEEFERAEADLADARELRETEEGELRAMADAEVEDLEARIAGLTEEAKRALLPRDPNDERNVIVEIRAGAGGDEAGIWAADLFRAYTRYAERHGWKSDLIEVSENTAGGFKEVIFQIEGKGAFSRLKFESGVHRVQRVPATEAQGRIHTSTATVAVLPEVEEVDLAIDESEIRMDLFHSGGAGGQNVNKVQTGVRLTHLPTNTVVTCTDERSQLKNKIKAMSVLRARLYDVEMERQHAERADARRAQVGRGDRAEKIRTYNYPENRVTDHRIGVTMHNLDRVVDGDLDALIDAVATAVESRMLEEQVA